MMKITRTSPVSNKTRTLELDITEEAYANWLAGTLIQRAFPNLSNEEREFILTGITGDEGHQIFDDSEIEVEDDEPAF